MNKSTFFTGHLAAALLSATEIPHESSEAGEAHETNTIFFWIFVRCAARRREEAAFPAPEAAMAGLPFLCAATAGFSILLLLATTSDFHAVMCVGFCFYRNMHI